MELLDRQCVDGHNWSCDVGVVATVLHCCHHIRCLCYVLVKAGFMDQNSESMVRSFGVVAIESVAGD